MTNEIKAFACCGKDQELVPWQYEPRPLGPFDVEVEISHCGICGSDIHTIDSGWGPANYPVVVGHEIVGKVINAGPQVTRFKLGDRVGIGAQVFSCQKKDCKQCSSNMQQLCPNSTFTYNGKYADGKSSYGGYAERVRVIQDFAFAIPAALSSEEAAPLLCAGITVFSPLKEYVKREGMTVGVVGIGGLGHLALQFAAKMKCNVVALSHSANKKKEAASLGANSFLDISDQEAMKAAKNTLDILVITSNHDTQPWEGYFSLMNYRSTMIMLAAPEKNLSIRPSALVLKEICLTGSLIGAPSEIEEMLKFAAEHNVKPLIEKVPMKTVNAAIKKVRDGTVRYRMVLEADFAPQ